MKITVVHTVEITQMLPLKFQVFCRFSTWENAKNLEAIKAEQFYKQIT